MIFKFIILILRSDITNTEYGQCQMTNSIKLPCKTPSKYRHNIIYTQRLTHSLTCLLFNDNMKLKVINSANQWLSIEVLYIG